MKGVNGMKRGIAILLAAVMLLSVAGCSGGEKIAASTGTWITYKEVFDHVKNDAGTDIMVYSYQQPVIMSSASGTNIINTKLNDATTAFLYGSGGVQEMTELAKMDWKESWFTSYSLTRDVSVARADDAVVSFRYSDYAFSGGVHGYIAEYGVNYDMVSGAQLEFRDLTDDEWALREVCRMHIMAELEDEENALKDALMPNYTQYLDLVLKNWVLTDEGLQFIAQPYVIAAYAVGTLRFTVPYEKIAHVLEKKWLPEDRGHGGGTIEMTVVTDAQPAPTNFSLDGQGMSLLVRVNGTIYDFSVEGVNSYPSEGTTVFYLTQQHLYSPKISSESFGLQLSIPDTRPNTMIRWKDGDGKEYQYYMTYDGVNGGVIMKGAAPQLSRD